jgi:hypothetical protein
VVSAGPKDVCRPQDDGTFLQVVVFGSLASEEGEEPCLKDVGLYVKEQ